MDASCQLSVEASFKSAKRKLEQHSAQLQSRISELEANAIARDLRLSQMEERSRLKTLTL
jgi:hypothetical protein